MVLNILYNQIEYMLSSMRSIIIIIINYFFRNLSNVGRVILCTGSQSVWLIWDPCTIWHLNSKIQLVLLFGHCPPLFFSSFAAAAISDYLTITVTSDGKIKSQSFLVDVYCFWVSCPNHWKGSIKFFSCCTPVWTLYMILPSLTLEGAVIEPLSPPWGRRAGLRLL